MAKRAAVVFAVKWFVVPIVLAAVGFFVLGPFVEGRAAVQDAKASAEVLEEPRRFTSEPDVDVSVAPAPRRAPSRTRSTPVRRTTVPDPPPPDDSPPPLADPPEDQAEPPPADAGGTVVDPGSTPPPPPTSGTADGPPPGTVPPPDSNSGG